MDSLVAHLVQIEDNVIKSKVDSAVDEASVGQIILDSLRKSGDKEVLVDTTSGRKWTASALLSRIEGLTRDLVCFGLNKGDVVAFYCSNSDRHVIGLVAVIAAGGVYTGCVSSCPYRELYNTVVNSGAVFLVCNEINSDIAQKVAADVSAVKKLFLLDGETPHITNASWAPLFDLPYERHPTGNAEHRVPVEVDFDIDLAIISFSSGTTGQPKAVKRTHKNIARSRDLGAPGFEFGSSEANVLSCHPPFCHNGGMTMLTSALFNGGKAIIMTGFEVEKWMLCVEKFEITATFLVPAYVYQLVKSTGDALKYDMSSLEDVLVAGAPFSKDVGLQFIDKFKPKCLRQSFGSSEIGWGTFSPLSCPLGQVETSGIPLNGLEMKLIDKERGQLLGPNQVGEVCVRGPQVTPGYLNNPLANRESFDAQGFFKSGDAGYYNAEGFLFIVDRFKEIIKFEGLQVPPAELESVLLTHEAVEEAAVIGIPHQLSGEVPKAFVVLKKYDCKSICEQELIDYVATQVAPYKQLRGGLEFVAAFPRTVIGKIDRKHLRSLTQR